MLGLQFRSWGSTEEDKLDDQLTEYLLLFPPRRILFKCRSARAWFYRHPRDWLVFTSESLILLTSSKIFTDISWPSINEIKLSRRWLLLFATRYLQVDYVESGRPKHATFAITRSDWHEMVSEV